MNGKSGSCTNVHPECADLNYAGVGTCFIRRDTLDGVKTIRVFRGPEGPNGELDPGKSQGYWFDEMSHLVKSYTGGFEIRPSAQEDYGGALVARRVDVLRDGKVGSVSS
jgi:hypothetical protein